MASKANKYASNGKLYSKDNPRPQSEAGIVVEGYYSNPKTLQRAAEGKLRPYRNPKRQAKKAHKVGI